MSTRSATQGCGSGRRRERLGSHASLVCIPRSHVMLQPLEPAKQPSRRRSRSSQLSASAAAASAAGAAAESLAPFPCSELADAVASGGARALPAEEQGLIPPDSLLMAASAHPATAAASLACPQQQQQQQAPSYRANRIHDNAATAYLTLEDELLDSAEDATPLSAGLMRLVLEYADLLGYRVLPRGPVQLVSAHTMPRSMQEAVAYRKSDHPSHVRSLSFQGGGSLVLSAALFCLCGKERKRLAVHPPLAAEARSNSQAVETAASEMHKLEPAAAATPMPHDASLASVTALPSHDRQCSWHVEELLLGAHALAHDAKRGWVVGVESTSRKPLVDEFAHESTGRLAIKSPPFARLHRRRFKYYRALPFGINLIADRSQPSAQSAWSESANVSEEAASVVTRGHEGDDPAVGITLVYARFCLLYTSPSPRD